MSGMNAAIVEQEEPRPCPSDNIILCMNPVPENKKRVMTYSQRVQPSCWCRSPISITIDLRKTSMGVHVLGYCQGCRLARSQAKGCFAEILCK